MNDSLVQVNGLQCLAATIRLPGTGVWVADLTVDGGSVISGRVAIRIGGRLELVGTAARTGLSRDTALLRVLGGAGGLSTEVAPKFYRRCPVKAPLQDVLQAAGETLSNKVDPGLLNRQLVAFCLVRQKASDALRALAERLGVTWRVLEDGTVWLGEESWPRANVALDLIAEDPRAGFTEYGSDSPTLLPGTKLDGKRVSQVEHRVEADRVRTRVWFENEGGAGDRMMAAISAVVRHLTAHVDHHALYPAKVVSQNGDGTLELQPDGERLPGLTKVPIRYGLPGVTVKVRKGARVLVGFEAGDAAAPVATLWESGTLEEVTVTAATKLTVSCPEVAIAADAGTKVTIGGTGATVNVGGEGATVNLGGAALGVARMGDQVQAGPFPGVITRASTKVKTGAA